MDRRRGAEPPTGTVPPGPAVRYEVTDADRAPLPPALRRAGKHLGYDADESTRPFARFFLPSTRPVQEHVRDALVSEPLPERHAYDVRDAVHRLQRRGHHRGETGWARLPGGVTYVACRTEMPGVTARMWDWWFGWHSTDPARYKLWHPDAHQFAAVGDDRSHDRTLTDRQRYVGNVSYVDEYIGDTLQRLAIRFVDPARLGFDDVPGTTHVCARVGFSGLPIAFGWLVHQVRPTSGGSEMRSRFFLNHVELLKLPGRSLPRSPMARGLSTPPARAVAARLSPRLTAQALPRSIGPDLLHHCGAEMNHLAGLLPNLHAEFAGTP